MSKVFLTILIMLVIGPIVEWSVMFRILAIGFLTIAWFFTWILEGLGEKR